MAALNELAASTWEYREKKPADAVMDNDPFLTKIKEKGRKITINGGRNIYEPITFAQNLYVQSIDANDEISIGYNQTLAGFEFLPKITVVPIVINALEKAQNQGEGQFLDLYKSRMQTAETSLENKFEAMAQGDGTGTGGKDWAGIKAYISKTPTTGTLGGLSRVTYSSIRNVAVNAVSTYGSATNASNIESRLRAVKNQLVRGADRPDFNLAGQTYFNAACDAMSAKQRFTQDTKLAEAGFDNVIIEGMTMVLAAGKTFSGLTGRLNDDECYLLNVGSFALKFYKGYEMQPVADRVSYNQLIDTAILAAIGNLTINNPGLNGVLFDS